MTAMQDSPQDTAPARAPACDLPLRENAPLENRSVPAPQKDINATAGGKIVNTGIYYGIGWLGNSAGSLFTTYFLNPRDDVTRGKETVIDFLANKVIKGANKVKTRDSVRSTVEILFMFISGVIATTIMTPLAMNRGKLAHKVNQFLGNRDKDVLPDSMKKLPEPKTLEDKIEQEIHKRVDKKHSAGDVWKARGVGMGLVLAGDYVVNSAGRYIENTRLPKTTPVKNPGGIGEALDTLGRRVGKALNYQSMDTLGWRLGQKLHDALPQSVVKGWTRFFYKHGASIEKIEENMKEHFQRLKDTELEFGSHGAPANKHRMVIAEQTRLVTKEMGWTLVMAVVLHQLVGLFNRRRVKKEEERAIAEITKEGLVPEGYKVTLEEGVKLERIDAKGGSWAEKSGGQKPQPQKSPDYATQVQAGRSAAESAAPAL